MNSAKASIVTTLLFSLSFVMTGCLKDDPEVFDTGKQFEQEVDAIDEYLESNTITHIKDMSGIRIVSSYLGSDLPAQASSTVDVKYKGTLFSTGAVFEESTTKGPVAQYIPGWQIALRKLPVGSEAKLYIPSYYAYGEAGNSKIPGNSTLVFDIKINSAAKPASVVQKLKSDSVAINTYLANKGITAETDPSGIRYINQQQGNGLTPSWFSKVKLKMTITLLSDDSKIAGTYDRQPTENFSSFVVDYIHGMQIALMKMKAGGKMRIFVPSGLAFGTENAVDGNTIVVPANSNIIVDIDLLEVL
ncbi:MAG TPA: FKBP-type peptidyl-prolyl cis-trans isomerase [Chryseosolibacter sp.]